MSNLATAIIAARRTANNFLRANHSGKFPVDVKILAKKLGLEIKEGTFVQDDVAGILKRDTNAGHPIIVVNSDDDAQRQRFTIAHEIGHFLMHADEQLHIDEDVEKIHFRNKVASQGSSLKEIQANQFAAELLMPSRDVYKHLKSLVDEEVDMVDIITKLAKRYKVSTTAMAIKLNRFIHQT